MTFFDYVSFFQIVNFIGAIWLIAIAVIVTAPSLFWSTIFKIVPVLLGVLMLIGALADLNII